MSTHQLIYIKGIAKNNDGYWFNNRNIIYCMISFCKFADINHMTYDKLPILFGSEADLPDSYYYYHL